MVTSLYEWKILEWDEKPQTKNYTKNTFVYLQEIKWSLNVWWNLIIRRFYTSQPICICLLTTKECLIMQNHEPVVDIWLLSVVHWLVQYLRPTTCNISQGNINRLHRHKVTSFPYFSMRKGSALPKHDCFFFVLIVFNGCFVFLTMFSQNRPIVCLVFFVCLWFFVPLNIFTLKWRLHNYWWRAANFDLCSALMAIEQWGFLSVPHLLWHRASVYNGHLGGPLTLIHIAERLSVELSLPVFTT